VAKDMTCLACIHSHRLDNFRHKCDHWGKEIPWDFLQKGCDSWSSLRIIHNRDAALIVCDLCGLRCVEEPRGVLPEHRPDGRLLCAASRTNRYTLSGERIKTEKRTAD
jgi:hypothetical protein